MVHACISVRTVDDRAWGKTLGPETLGPETLGHDM